MTRRHPDFKHPFDIEDWAGVEIRAVEGPDGLWDVLPFRNGRPFDFKCPPLPHLTKADAQAQADRMMTAARRVLNGEI